MRVHGHVGPGIQQAVQAADMVEVPVGENDGGGRRIGPEKRFGLLFNLACRAGQARVDEHPRALRLVLREGVIQVHKYVAQHAQARHYGGKSGRAGPVGIVGKHSVGREKVEITGTRQPARTYYYGLLQPQS